MASLVCKGNPCPNCHRCRDWQYTGAGSDKVYTKVADAKCIATDHHDDRHRVLVNHLGHSYTSDDDADADRDPVYYHIVYVRSAKPDFSVYTIHDNYPDPTDSDATLYVRRDAIVTDGDTYLYVRRLDGITDDYRDGADVYYVRANPDAIADDVPIRTIAARLPLCACQENLLEYE